MNITKETILRLAKDAGLSDEGAAKLERDLDLFTEGQGGRYVVVPSVLSTGGTTSFDSRAKGMYTGGDQHHDVIGNLGEAAQEKLASGHGYG